MENIKNEELKQNGTQAPSTEQRSTENGEDVLKTTKEEGSDSQNSNPKDDDSGNETNSDVDYYKAELERIKAENERTKADANNYREGLLALKDKLKNSKEDGGKKNEDLDSFREELKAELENFKSGYVSDIIADNINQISTDQNEAELVKYHYENTIVRSGTSKEAIKQDIARAKLLANEGKIKREFEEIRRAFESEQTKERSSDWGSQRTSPGQEISLNSAEKEIVERFAKRKGVTFEEAKQNFIKNNLN